MMPRYRRFMSVLAGLVPTTTAFAVLTPAAAATCSEYVMRYFTESNQGLGNKYGLHLALSLP